MLAMPTQADGARTSNRSALAMTAILPLGHPLQMADTFYVTRPSGNREVGVEEVLTAPRSPRQKGERVIGSLRRECPDHMIIISEAHLRRVLTTYLQYYLQLEPVAACLYHLRRPRQQPARVADREANPTPTAVGGERSHSGLPPGGWHGRQGQPRRVPGFSMSSLFGPRFT